MMAMRALSAEELLDVWEAGCSQAPTERALLLLAAACPETPAEALATLSIGARDAKLFALREKLWGPQMESVVACPSCRERLELNLDTHQMLASSPPEQPREIRLGTAGYEMTVRLPNSRDFLELAGEGEPGPVRIAQRCLLAVNGGEVPVDLDNLTEEALAAITQVMAEADPLADIRLALACPACQNRWSAVFDIVSFIWTEIEAWAWRILSDVHTLARAYGWGEREILSLSPTRRQFYLDMVGA